MCTGRPSRLKAACVGLQSEQWMEEIVITIYTHIYMYIYIYTQSFIHVYVYIERVRVYHIG